MEAVWGEGDGDARDDPFARVHPSHGSDYLLHNTNQSLVALTSQADLKASIVITTSSIVLSIVATRIQDPTLRVAGIVFSIGVLVALVLALLAVLPGFRMRAEMSREHATFNPLFFGHISSLSLHEYEDHMADVLADPAMTYRVQVRDLYAQSRYVMASKYRFLRLSYIALLCSFIAGGITLLITAA